MIGLIQRVQQASVTVNNNKVGNISKGLLLFIGIEKHDTEASVKTLAKKVANIRIFEDDNGKMNESLLDTKGEILVISQFTLVANTQKGNRPGFSDAAPPALSEALYEYFLQHFEHEYIPCQSGQFGANMQVALINDGPATFTITV